MLELFTIGMMVFVATYNVNEYGELKRLPEEWLLYKNIKDITGTWKFKLLIDLVTLVFLVIVIVIAIVVSVQTNVNQFDKLDVFFVIVYPPIYASKFLYIIKTNIKLKNKNK